MLLLSIDVKYYEDHKTLVVYHEIPNGSQDTPKKPLRQLLYLSTATLIKCNFFGKDYHGHLSDSKIPPSCNVVHHDELHPLAPRCLQSFTSFSSFLVIQFLGQNIGGYATAQKFKTIFLDNQNDSIHV
jgi:hypothetical protein